ncbi:MAG: glycosyltransferase family 39 protein [Acidobacteriota bacterium]
MSEKSKDFLYALLFFLVAALLFGALFNRETTLSHSIGYSLYGAERILDGEIPYRDFHTLYPPAIIYLNAAVFKLFGVSLYNALLAVFLFKALTSLAIYLCARQLMPRAWAIAAAAFSIVWLRPNGPFKAVPMHYGALFLALALFLLLRYLQTRKTSLLVAAGLSIGLLTLFKHNIGAYALVGSLAVVAFDEERSERFSQLAGNYRRALMLVAGLVIAVLPVCAYMFSRDALAAMIRTLALGPGEFLLSRLAATPSPLVALTFFGAMAAAVFAVYVFRSNPLIVSAIAVLTLIPASAFLLLANQSLVDSLIFYAPVLTIALGLAACFWGRRAGVEDQRALFLVVVFVAAAFMETFPRFAREQAVAAMPFVALLLFYLIHLFRPAIEELLRPAQANAALSVLPVMILLIGARLFFSTYFDEQFHFKSNTELTVERGRKVYFPAEKASEIDGVTAYLQQRIPAGGYFFAQTYAGSSYLFLADRNNPSGAQFWGGVGVTDAERAETMASIEEKRVELILTSQRDIEAEKYEPMRRYIDENFQESRRFGEVIIMERKPKL